MKQLLAICWEMPPLSGPRAVQVTRTLRELATTDAWGSRVVCFGPRSTRYQQDYDIALDEVDRLDRPTDGVRLVHVPSPEEWLLFRVLWRVCPPFKLMPDEKRVWVGRALAAARRLLAEAPADLIVSFAQPWSDHLVALQLHRETGLPWVAHFSDPWVDNPYLRGAAWQRRIWERMERDVIAAATRLVFVNAQTADRVMSKYPAEWRDRMSVVPQGYDRTIAPPSDRRAAGPLRIVYTGRFYPGVRTPIAFLDAIALRHRQTSPAGRAGLDRLTGLTGRLVVDFVGGAMEPYRRRAADLGLGGVVTFHGRRSPSEAQTLAAAADVLLVIDAPSDGPSLFLPSKVIDYLPLRAPILGLTPAAGATADLLSRLGYAIVDPSDPLAIAAAIDRLLASHEAGTLGPSDRHDEVAQSYDIRVTTRAFRAVMDEAVRAA